MSRTYDDRTVIWTCGLLMAKVREFASNEQLDNVETILKVACPEALSLLHDAKRELDRFLIAKLTNSRAPEER